MKGAQISYRPHFGAYNSSFLNTVAPADWTPSLIWAVIFYVTRRSLPLVSLAALIFATVSAYRTLRLNPKGTHLPTPPGPI